MTVNAGYLFGNPDWTTNPNAGLYPLQRQGVLIPGSVGYSMLKSRSARANAMPFVTLNSSIIISVLMQDIDTGAALDGLTLTIQQKKPGGGFTTVTPTVTPRSNGRYDLALDAAHTNVVGISDFLITAPGAADNNDIQIEVINIDLFDSVRGGMTAIPNANAGAVGGLGIITAIGQGPGGQIKANSFNDKYVYDTQGRMTSCRMRVFANKATADTASDSDADGAHGEVERFRVTVTYNTDSTIKTYEYAKEL